MIHISHWVFMTGCHVKFKVQIVLWRNHPLFCGFFDENDPYTQFLARTKHMCTNFNLSATNWYVTCMTVIEWSRYIGKKRQKPRHQLLFSNWKYIYTNELKISYGSCEQNLWRLFGKTGIDLDKTNRIFGILAVFPPIIGVNSDF